MSKSSQSDEQNRTLMTGKGVFVRISLLLGAIFSLFIGIIGLRKQRDGARQNQMSNHLYSAGDLQANETGITYGKNKSPGEEWLSMGKNSQGIPVGFPVGSNEPSLAAGVGVNVQEPINMQANKELEKQWKPATKYLVSVGLFLAFLYVFYLSTNSLRIMIFASLLAFIVQPVVGFFEHRFKFSKRPSIVIAYLLVIVILIIIPLLLIPALVNSVNNVLAVDWQAIGQNASLNLHSTSLKVYSIPVVGSAVASLLDSISLLISGASALDTPNPIVLDVSYTSIGGQLAQMLGKLANILGPLISAGISLVFMLLLSLRLSLAADQIHKGIPKLVPSAYQDEITNLVDRIANIWVSFLRSQLTLMVVMGVLVYLLNLILGNSNALFLGLMAGILEIIPSLGPLLATIPAVILALIFGSSNIPINNFLFAGIIVLGYFLLSVLENQIIVPKLLGEAVDLPPLAVVLGVVIGGAAFGILGIFLASPIISSSKELFNYFYNKIMEPPLEIKVTNEKPSLMDSFKGFLRRIPIPGFRKISPKKTDAPFNHNES